MDHSPQEARLLTQVLPNVAAQFRTTLGNMHAALSSGDDPDACILRQSYYRLLRTVTNLTDAVMLAEDTPLPRQDTDLTVFFDELCRQAREPLSVCGVTLETDLRPRQLTVGINREYTARIFWNLLSNAAKFTPTGGSVRVTLTQQGSRALLQVADTGCGIHPDLQDTVYDRIPAPQSAWIPCPHGLGLGLSLCPVLCRAPGGQSAAAVRGRQGHHRHRVPAGGALRCTPGTGRALPLCRRVPAGDDGAFRRPAL